MPKPRDFFLSDADNAAIFEDQIRPAEFGDGGADSGNAATASGSAVTPSRPVCIILAGQTGAGKSHAAPALAAALQGARRGPHAAVCHLVADTHKPYHPAYAALVADAAAGRAPPGLASAATGHDARRWLVRACAVAASAARPTLVESASRYPGDVVEMAGIFRRAGFRVCLVLLAVHAVQSRLGLLARFLDATDASDEGGAGPRAAAAQQGDRRPAKPSLPVRLTPRPIHDESYAGLATLAAMLDADGPSPAVAPLADAVLILRRGNLVAYENYAGTARSSLDGPPQWQTAPPAVGRALAIERARRPPPAASMHAGATPVAAEAALFSADVARLQAKHPERAAELDALAAEYEAAMAEDAGDGDGDGDGEGKGAGADNSAVAALNTLHPLDPAALVAHLQSNEW